LSRCAAQAHSATRRRQLSSSRYVRRAQGCQGERAAHFSPTDLRFIADFHALCAPNLLLHLSHSLCPTILGLPLIKVALVLSLLGGTRARDGRGARNAIHVLLIGDPGLGKSALLHAAVAAAPRGMYVCSKTSTGAGLTVSVTKDVVVLADGGVCALDELDNMRGEHKTLLEVMEQQEVRCCRRSGGPLRHTRPRCAVQSTMPHPGSR
jgi:DNA replicative helicase MCM subunit Mcm2 (Cdc46/Mcm family)